MSRNSFLLNRRNCLFLAAGHFAALASSAGAWAEDASTQASWTDLDRVRSNLSASLGNAPSEIRKLKDHLRVRFSSDILFKDDREALSPEGVDLISLVAAALIKAPSVSVEVVAHEAGGGNSFEAYVRSLRQAEDIKAALFSRTIPLSRIQATGLGNNFPLKDPVSAEGKKENWRIELLFRISAD